MTKLLSPCLLIYALLALPQFLQAQSPRTLFGEGAGEGLSLGFYISPAYQLTTATGRAVHNFQGSAGLLINRRFSIGGAFYASANEFTPSGEADPNLYLDLYYGGLRAEYIWNPDGLVHLSFPVTVGFGEAEMDLRRGERDFNEAYFFFVEPGVQVEVNLTSYLRLVAGGTYRFASGMSYTYNNLSQAANTISGADISGWGIHIGLRIGKL